MSHHEQVATSPVLPTLDHTESDIKEKQSDNIEEIGEKAGSTYGTESGSFEEGQDVDNEHLVKGERVIVDGNDVSRHLLTTRDDGDAALTFRSAVLGTIFAGLGAALCQVCNIAISLMQLAYRL